MAIPRITVAARSGVVKVDDAELTCEEAWEWVKEISSGTFNHFPLTMTEFTAFRRQLDEAAWTAYWNTGKFMVADITGATV